MRESKRAVAALLFSGVCLGGGLVSAGADVSLVDGAVVPGSARDGETVTLRYRIDSSGSATVQLGARLTGPQGQHVADLTPGNPGSDVQIRNGSIWYDRPFYLVLSPNAGPGDYAVEWKVELEGGETLSYVEQDALQVPAPVAVRVPVIMYHKIGPVAHSRYWVSSEQFEAQMRMLRDLGYTAVTMRDILDYRAGIKPIPEKPVLITLDDGYEDLYTEVYPIISRPDIQMKVTAFIPTGVVGGDNSWDEGLDFDQEPVVNHLSWDQMRTLHASGLFDFQSHSVTHRGLRDLSDAQLKAELVDSRAKLESELGKEVRFFSYPFGQGEDDDRIRRAVYDAGYHGAVGVIDTMERTSHDKYALHRLDIHWMIDVEPDPDVPEFYFAGFAVLDDPDAGTPPRILTHPEGRTVGPGDSVTLSVEAENNNSLGYQWRHNGVAIDGANAATLVINDVQVSDTGDYTVVVSNLWTSVESNPARVEIAGQLENSDFFVRQQYRDFLGREGDEDGVAFWVQRLENGTSDRALVIDNFLFSEEFAIKVAPVARLYLAYFLRIPDTDGLFHWIDEVAGGHMSLNEVSDFFAESDEFEQRYGELNNEDFVTRVYENVLDRQPEDEGRDYWTGKLENGEMTRGAVMTGFSESQEYRQLTLNEVNVIMIYSGMLRRAPEEGGFLFWVDELDNGRSARDLIQGFLDSDEYTSRF